MKPSTTAFSAQMAKSLGLVRSSLTKRQLWWNRVSYRICRLLHVRYRPVFRLEPEDTEKPLTDLYESRVEDDTICVDPAKGTRISVAVKPPDPKNCSVVPPPNDPSLLLWHSDEDWRKHVDQMNLSLTPKQRALLGLDHKPGSQ